MLPAAVPAEAVRVAHAVRVDLAERAGLADERVRRPGCRTCRWRCWCRAGRCAGSCRAAAPGSAGRCFRRPGRRRRPRGRAGRSRASPRLGACGLKSICWMPWIWPREAEPQHLAAGAAEGVRAPGSSAVHSVMHAVVRACSAARVRSGVLVVSGAPPRCGRCRTPVARELRVEGDEPEAAAQAAAGEEVRRERRADVEVDLRLAVRRAGTACR